MRLSLDGSPELEPLGHIGKLKLKSEFERCWPWLEESLKLAAYHHGGKVLPTHNKEHLWAAIQAGRAYLWPFSTCVLLTEIITYPTGLKNHNTWLSGGNLDAIVQVTPLVEAWGRAQGCHQQVGSGRRGWLRALSGYVEYAVRRHKDLRA